MAEEDSIDELRMNVLLVKSGLEAQITLRAGGKSVDCMSIESLLLYPGIMQSMPIRGLTLLLMF